MLGVKAFQKIFLFDIELPERCGLYNVGGRVYVRFDHGWEPLIWRWYQKRKAAVPEEIQCIILPPTIPLLLESIRSAKNLVWDGLTGWQLLQQECLPLGFDPRPHVSIGSLISSMPMARSIEKLSDGEIREMSQSLRQRLA